ncbi:hypothetical protein GLOIN_2v1764231 [Rhizophagus clarus]|uniref:Uncharacterized protein n=1 Tax=Rhizophagus clarus TaxID=94130 RepID=A0A8H3LB93_9GLOM|nr:hypothetical protein GLOIN_2v1764231 [Rhizophagus clarus]
MLRIAPSVNLTSPGHFFAYDEALETFGVKFVKQNVTRIPTDSEELKLKIKATQLEKEQTDMLICDYIGDYIQSSKSRINQLVATYDIGIRRLQAIVNQEILLTEDYITVERRAKNITCVTVADISKMKKEKKIEVREEKEKEKESKRGRGRGREKGRGRGEGEEKEEEVNKPYNERVLKIILSLIKILKFFHGKNNNKTLIYF